MLSIMVGMPQWFQVYDQQPFAILKKSMGRTNNGFSRVTSLGPKEMNAFMEDIFMTVESKALVPENVQKSFADLGLYPWNPDTTGELCRKHCHHPTLLNATSWLRKLGKIISNNSAEQKAKQTILRVLQKHMVLDSRKKEPQYHVCNRKTESPQDSEGLSKHGVPKRSNKSVEMQPLAKRPERLQTVRRPRR